MALAIILFLFAAFSALSAITTVFAIGRPRKPITPGFAAAVVIINASWVTVLVLAGMRLLS